VEESWAQVATLAATVAEMRDTIKSLSAENGALRNELQTAHKELGAPQRHPVLRRQRQRRPPALHPNGSGRNRNPQNPEPTHKIGAGHLPYANRDALKACRAKRYDRPGSAPADDIGTSPQ
jgi:septal ring factor EnvC (AmiA/AmiB activator)